MNLFKCIARWKGITGRSQYATALDVILRSESLHKYIHPKHKISSQKVRDCYQIYKKDKKKYKAIGMLHYKYIYIYISVSLT
jgi:hypothetical protein